MRIGVVGLQGDVSEHVEAVARAIRTFGHTGEAFLVRRRADLDRAEAITIPGGESTTISKLLVKLKLFDEVVRRTREESLPILGTWGDCRPLASYGDKIVLARQGNLIAAAFHPELSGDLRIHGWFLDLV